MLGQWNRLEPLLAGSARRDRAAFVSDRAVSRGREEQVRHARCSSTRSKRDTEALSAPVPQRAAGQVRHSAAAGASDVSTSNHVPGGREFFNWIVDLPWNRLGVWLVVAWFVYQLKDFFGVSGQGPSLMWGCASLSMPLCGIHPWQKGVISLVCCYRLANIHRVSIIDWHPLHAVDTAQCMHLILQHPRTCVKWQSARLHASYPRKMRSSIPVHTMLRISLQATFIRSSQD